MNERFYPGDVIGIFGYLRQGKTMQAVRLAAQLNLMGYQVLTNIATVFATRSLALEDFLAARATVLLLDELQATLDSREFKANVVLTQQLIYTGKRGNILIYTAPDISMVDKRVRQLTNWIYAATKIRPGLSLVTRAWFNGSGMVIPKGKYLLRHQVFGPLYDTLDEDVVLRPGPGSPPPSTASLARCGTSTRPPPAISLKDFS